MTPAEVMCVCSASVSASGSIVLYFPELLSNAVVEKHI